MLVMERKAADVPTMDGSEVSAALYAEEAALISWNSALDVLADNRSPKAYDAALVAAQAYIDAGIRARKAMRIGEVIARAKINHGF